MRLPFQPVTVTLAAGATRQIIGDIRFFLFYDATAVSNVQARFGNSRDGLAGSFVGLVKGFKNGPLSAVDTVEIKNTSGAPNTITIVYGSDDFTYTQNTVVSSTTIADGADATQGAKADAAATTDGGTFSIVALIKRLLGKFPVNPKGVRVRGQTGSMVGVADVDVIAAPAAGTHLVVKTILVYCAHATTATAVAIKDGATELFRVYVRAGSAIEPAVPTIVTIPDGIQLTSATALKAANITNASDTNVVAFGVTEAD